MDIYTILSDNVFVNKNRPLSFSHRIIFLFRKEDNTMKGYYVSSGYMGYVDGVYMLFSTEEEYKEYLKES